MALPVAAAIATGWSVWNALKVAPIGSGMAGVHLVTFLLSQMSVGIQYVSLLIGNL